MGAVAAAAPAAARVGGTAQPAPWVDLDRDTLENMHDLLTSNFALGDRRETAGSRAGAGAARSTRASAAATAAVAAAAREVMVEVETPPLVWVTRYVDYSSKYGLGFLLSDGSAGVYFNDATKIVLEPAGLAFDYVERARRSSPAVEVEGERQGGGARAGAAASEKPPPRVRHTLEDFPPELQKKVTLLNHFRGYLHELVKKDEGAGGVLSTAGRRGGTGDGGRDEATPARGGGGQGAGGEPLTFLKKWLRTRNAILFRLSNRTVQVVFSDHTEILLSKDARVITFVDKNGKRETRALQRVLDEQR